MKIAGLPDQPASSPPALVGETPGVTFLRVLEKAAQSRARTEMAAPPIRSNGSASSQVGNASGAPQPSAAGLMRDPGRLTLVAANAPPRSTSSAALNPGSPPDANLHPVRRSRDADGISGEVVDRPSANVIATISVNSESVKPAVSANADVAPAAFGKTGPASLEQDAAQRAFSLSELGLLGHPAAVSAPTVRRGADISAANDARLIANASSAALPNSPSAFGAAQKRDVSGGATLGSVMLAPQGLTVEAHVEASHRGAPISLGSTVGIVSSRGLAPRSPQVASEAPPSVFGTRVRGVGADAPSDGDGVSVIVAQEDGAVQVVAAGAGIDGVVGVKLRAIATGILAEFGMALTDFSLNGTSVSELPVAIAGVLHGRNTR